MFKKYPLSISLPGFFTAPDNADYILLLERPGSNNVAVYIDDVDFTYEDETYSMVCTWYISDSYRFAFNGKEKTDDMYGEGNMYDYGFRIYDPRIGRFLSTDPLANKFPYYTPYQFAGNKPIFCLDLDGLEDIIYWVTMRTNGTAAFTVETGYDLLGKGVQAGTYFHVSIINEKDEVIETYHSYIAPNPYYPRPKVLPNGVIMWGNSSRDESATREGTTDGKGGVEGFHTPGGGADPVRSISKILGIAKQFVGRIVKGVQTVRESGSEDTPKTPDNKQGPNSDSIVVLNNKGEVLGKMARQKGDTRDDTSVVSPNGGVPADNK